MEGWRNTEVSPSTRALSTERRIQLLRSAVIARGRGQIGLHTSVCGPLDTVELPRFRERKRVGRIGKRSPLLRMLLRMWVRRTSRRAPRQQAVDSGAVVIISHAPTGNEVIT